MPQIISFIPREAVTGGDATLYSEVYEVSSYAQIVAEIRVHTFAGAGTISAILQDTMEPCLAPDSLWRDAATQTATWPTGNVNVFSGSGLLRFARMKLVIPATLTGAIISVEGEGKEHT